MPEREIMTSEEAAQELRCSRAHITHLAQGTVRGVPRLPSIRMGRRRLFRRESLRNWVAEVEALSVPLHGQDSPPAAVRQRRMMQ